MPEPPYLTIEEFLANEEPIFKLHGENCYSPRQVGEGRGKHRQTMIRWIKSGKFGRMGINVYKADREDGNPKRYAIGEKGLEKLFDENEEFSRVIPNQVSQS